MTTAAQVRRTFIPIRNETMVSVKVPKGYPHAGRWARATAEDDSTFTVFVPRKRRVTSARITPAASFVINKEDVG